MEKRIKPLALAAQFNFGQSLTADGVLNIYPRADSTQHPIGGHFYLGENAYPFTGRIEGLRIVSEPTSPRGRPPKTARDMAVLIAYDSFFQHATDTLPKHKVQSFAKNRCLDLWRAWPGIQEAAALRTAKRNAKRALGDSGRALLTWTGNAPDLSDYVAVLALAGATWQVQGGVLQIKGPAWVWRWGEETAEHFAKITAKAGASGPDTALMIL